MGSNEEDRVVYAYVNAPGSWHDSIIAQEFYSRFLKSS